MDGVSSGPVFFFVNQPSTLLARRRGDPLAESWTHADGVVGHLVIGAQGKTDLSLLPGAMQLLVVEAKMFSELSSGVIKAKYFDQAARTVACIAEVFHRANMNPHPSLRIGFYVLAPNMQIKRGLFSSKMNRNSIQQKIIQRVEEYGGEKNRWYSESFEPLYPQITIKVISWEEILSTIENHDPENANSYLDFYKKCIRFNRN